MLGAALPDLDSLDLQAAKALLIAQHEHFKEQHTQYKAALSSRASEMERLVLLVAKLQHMLFGRKSEKVLRQIEQLGSLSCRSKIYRPPVSSTAPRLSRAMAGCVLPTPGGPSRSTFSLRSRKASPASSRSLRSSTEGWKPKSNWSSPLL